MVLLGVGETASQSVSVKPVDGRLPILPCVGDPGRTGEALIVIEEDPVLFDVGELSRIEKKLCGADVRAASPLIGRIQIGGKPTRVIVCREFASVNLAALVIERRKDKRFTELAFIQNRMRTLVETIDAYIETFGNLLRHTGIEIMRALRFRDGILLN